MAPTPAPRSGAPLPVHVPTPPEPDSGPQPTAPSGRTETVLLYRSADRVLLWRRPRDGESNSQAGPNRASDPGEIWKVLRRGSPQDAQREVHLGQRLAGPGIAEYLRVDREPTTGRPVVVVRAVQGQDLHNYILSHGPLAMGPALRVAAALAEALGQIHAALGPDAPRGFVHNDVKPSNLILEGVDSAPNSGDRELLAPVLIDLEHAVPAPESGVRLHLQPTCTGGTPQLSPPEQWAGAAPDHPADIHGVGVVLHWMLTGHLHNGATLDRCGPGHMPRNRRPMGCLPQRVREVIEACLSPDPEGRPDAQSLAKRLAHLAGMPPDRAVQSEAARSDKAEAQAGDPLPAEALHTVGARTEVPERWRQRVPLPELPRHPAAGSATTDRPRDGEAALAALRVGIPRARLLRRHAPGDPGVLRWLRQGAERTAAWLDRIPAVAAELLRRHDFPRAEALLDAALAVQDAARGLPTPQAGGAGQRDGWLVRDTAELLHNTREEIARGAARHRALTAQLESAEASFDLEAVRAAVQEIIDSYGGASESTAQAKDRAHRLAFYLERIARGSGAFQALVEECRAAVARSASAGGDLQPVDLAPLHQLAQRCCEATGTSGDPGRRGGERLRPLLRLLKDFIGEFPHLESQLKGAHRAMDQALAQITCAGWSDLRVAQEQLTANPVPVRLLQTTLDRLDALQLRELLVDLPDRTRGELLDAVESLRMKVDQARATRDRIASGAEQDLARGHWTTALYEMERAAEQFAAEVEPGQNDGDAARKLSQRLAEAKRRKRQLEQMLRRNVELASQYAALQDNPESSMSQRLSVLVDRQRVLQSLLEVVPKDRLTPYQQDLLEVQIHIATEQAEEAERNLDICQDPQDALQICTEALELLHGVPMPPGRRGRLHRLAEHWERRRQIALGEVTRLEGDALEAKRRRRRATLTAAGTVVVLVGLGLGLWQGGWLASPVQAAVHGSDRWYRELEAAPELSTSGDPIVPFHVVRALRQLGNAKDALREQGASDPWANTAVPDVERIVTLLEDWADWEPQGTGQPAFTTALGELEGAFAGLEQPFLRGTPEAQRGLTRFAHAALRVGAVLLNRKGLTKAETLAAMEGWDLAVAKLPSDLRRALSAD